MTTGKLFMVSTLRPSDANSDPDNDLLVAADEFLLGTSENNPDTDSDEIPDGAEFAFGLDPLNPSDAQGDLDGDGFTNLREYLTNTDPTDDASMPEVEEEPASGLTYAKELSDSTSRALISTNS